MFRLRPDSRPAAAAMVAVEVEGRAVLVPEGASAAAAVLLAGLPSLRDTAVQGTPRAPYCLMGVCFDCLAEIDGVPNRQSCMIMAESGMRVVGVEPAAERVSAAGAQAAAPVAAAEGAFLPFRDGALSLVRRCVRGIISTPEPSR